MSSGEPMGVTISMRVHGVEMKLGKLALGPTGQLVIETREEATVPAQHHRCQNRDYQICNRDRYPNRRSY
jgi:hypothetical protein